MAINFEDYLITFEARFNKNINRTLRNVSSTFRNFPEKLRKNLSLSVGGTSSRITVGISRIALKSQVKIPKQKWTSLAKATDELRNDLFGGGDTQSLFDEIVAEKLDTIFTNVAVRFVNANLDSITGNLADAMSTQNPAVDEFKTIGIRAGIGNIEDLNRDTEPYRINKKTGEVTMRKATTREYKYTTADGTTVEDPGYWAFQEFGTSNGVRKRAFWLSLARELHTADEAKFKEILVWLRERINGYNNRAREIMG